MSDVEKWKKRLNRKGPFYLLRAEKFEHTIVTWTDGVRHDEPVVANRYVVIWNEGNKDFIEKTKIGSFSDYMWCRYGVQTRASLNGDRPHDLWNGASVTDEEFEEMLAVRNEETPLPEFSLDNLVGLVW